MKQIVLCVCLVGLLLCAISLCAIDKPSTPIKASVVKERAYTGFLSDAGSATEKPAKQNLETLKLSDSGFGILLKGPKGNFIFHKFDAKGDELVKSEVLEQATPKDHLIIKATGTMDKTGMIAVRKLELLKKTKL
jgi:hypothetical protein